MSDVVMARPLVVRRAQQFVAEGAIVVVGGGPRMGKTTLARQVDPTLAGGPRLVRDGVPAAVPADVAIVACGLGTWPAWRSVTRLHGRPVRRLPLGACTRRMVREWLGLLPSAGWAHWVDAIMVATGGHPWLIDAIVQCPAPAEGGHAGAAHLDATLRSLAPATTPVFHVWRELIADSPERVRVWRTLCESPAGLDPVALASETGTDKTVLDDLCLLGPVARYLDGERAVIAAACGLFRAFVAAHPIG